MALRASEGVIEFACASSARRRRMRRVLAGVAVAARGGKGEVGVFFRAVRGRRGGNTPVAKGPGEGAEGEVVAVNIFGVDNEIKEVSRLKGKIALMVTRGQPKKDFMVILFSDFGSFVKAAGKAGAIAVIDGSSGVKNSGMNLTHTGILGFDADFAVPILSMTAEDQGQLERYVEGRKKVSVRFNVQNTFSSGPVEAANVVGEIRGRENPEQLLVVGAHLDSWDLSEGATDNGTGSASVLGSAEAIVRSGMRPRRTIRFVFVTG